MIGVFKIFLLLILIPTIGLSQLKGEYCYSNEFSEECYSFLDSNKFEYRLNDCTGPRSGRGVYLINGNELTLEFQEDTNYNKVAPLIHKFPSTTDSLLIEVEVIDEHNGEALHGAVAWISDKLTSYTFGIGTDSSGHGTFKVPKTLTSSVLTIELIGYTSYSDTLKLDSNYVIVAKLKSNWGYDYYSNQHLKYRIKNIRKRKISLKKDYEYAKFCVYKRRRLNSKRRT